MNLIHQKLVLFTAQAYLQRAVDDGITKETLHKRLIGAIDSWKMMRRFSKKELEVVSKIGEDKYILKLKETEVSHVVYALELLRMWAENAGHRDTIGVSKKLLRKGRSVFVIDMLKIKKRDPVKHKELREIIDQSVITAKGFFMFTENYIEEREKQ